MKILLIKPRHIGDTLVLTPTIKLLKQTYPQCQLYVLVRKGCEGILQGCPWIDDVLTTVAPESKKRKWSDSWHDWQTLRRLRALKLDWAIDLSLGVRGRWMTLFSGAKQKASASYHEDFFNLWHRFFSKSLDLRSFFGHAVETDAVIVNQALPIPLDKLPPLVFEQSLTASHYLLNDNSRYAVVHPGTRWKRKRWTLQGWIDTCIHLLKKVDYIVLSTGADAQEVELAQDIQRGCGEGVILTEGKLSWKQNADLLYRSKLFVGVDTAMMHLAAACQCKIVAIWGPTWEGIWRPWQADCRLIMPQGFAPLPYNLPLEERAIIEQRLTAKVCTEDVIRACDEMLEGT